MRSRLAATGTFSPAKKEFSPAASEKAAEEVWEVRPGGMLVQKREDSDRPAAPVPAIRVKVKHNGAYHEIYISSQATFGELKKELAGRTGLHPLDQKVLYKDKERDSAAFLDTAGVKDRSKLTLVEDPVARAKRLLEERKVEKMEKATRSISAISLEVDKLASKVSALEGIVKKGGRVVEDDVVVLIEQLMNELVKLDGIVATDGDVKLQKRMQVKRVQKYVESLDVIKAKNTVPKSNGHINKQHQPQQKPSPPPPAQQQQQNQHYYNQQPLQTQTHFQHKQQQQQQQQERRQLQEVSAPAPAPATANWEFFDSLFTPATSTPTSSTTTAASTASSTPTTRFDWELF